MKIRAFSIFITILSLFTFVSCDFHNQNVKEYLEHWTNTGQIVGHSFENSYQTNSSGITCLPTDSSQTVSLELHNPQKYNLQFEYIFDEAAVQEAANSLTSPVTIDISDDRFSATAVFSRQFLEKIDEEEAIGGKNISGHITIFEPDSARYFDPYTIALSANTPPDEIKNPLMQLTEDGAGSYILCFYVPTYSAGHKQTDTTKLYINGTSYDYNPVYGTVTGTGFSSTYSGTLHPCASNGLTFSSVAPAGYKTVYYETGTAFSNDEVRFNIKLEDDYGLAYTVGVSNKAKKLNTPTFSVTASSSYASDEESGTYNVTITAPTTNTDDTSCGTGVTVNYTITQTSSGTPAFNGSTTLTGSAVNSKTIALPKGTYTISATASKAYYITSNASEVTGVKITQPAIFYVAETGDDSGNTGALNSPYRTIQHALDVFSAGIPNDYPADAICEVRVKTDLTTPDDFWTATPAPTAIITIPAKADATVKIKGYGAVRTLTAANVPEDASYEFFEAASGSSTIVLENLKFNSGNCNTLEGISINNGKLNTATNCEFYNTNSASDDNSAVINIGSGSQLTLTNCEIHDNNVRGIYNGGTLTLTNVTIQNNTTSSNGGAIYNYGSLTLEGCTITGNKCGASDEYNGGAIYNNNDSTGFFIKGNNQITGNTYADGTTPSNIYLPGSTKKLQVTGSLAGSSIGVYKSTAPSIDHPVIFTDGFKTNNGSLLPGAVFTSDKGYAVALEGNEAAFAVSSGGMYLPTDFTFTFEVKDAAGNAATGMYPGVAKTFTVIPTITRKGAGETTATTIAYADIATDVTWTASLYNGGTLAQTWSNAQLPSVTGGITVTVPPQSYVDTYTLKVTAEYLGVTHDISVPLDYSYSAENAASYISTLTSAGTYNVKVTGGVGSGIDNTTDEITSSDAGLAKVAKAIRALPGGVLINLDPKETSATSTITTYNDGKYFKDCTALRSITLPDWMQYVITSLFEGCTQLTSVTLSSKTQWIKDNAFKGCTSLATINYEGTISQWAEVTQGSGWHTGVPATVIHCIDGDSRINPLAATPLTLEAMEAGAIVTFSNKANGPVTYKVNGGSAQTIPSGESTPITLTAAGDKVEFYGDNAAYGVSSDTVSDNTNISCSKNCYVYGNIMSLIKSSDFENETELSGSYIFKCLFKNNTHINNKEGCALLLPATTIKNNCYRSMFQGCSGLTQAPALPATTLAVSCYNEMFDGCTSLTQAPELPATNLANYCYTEMFYGCTSLETAPELPATSLFASCYSSMFCGCTSLTTAPALPATTLADSCYFSMFEGCTGLTAAPELPATTLASSCYTSMFYGCTSLTTAPALPATTLTSNCYYSMFQGCTSLASAPALPATTLATSCYYSMFQGCTSLAAVPALPATTLSSTCYQSMFKGCTVLTTAPALPATTLADSCYREMFSGCTSLTAAPALSATTMTEYCYANMFNGCTTLTAAPELSATTLSDFCYYSMFCGCTSLTAAPALPATTLVSGCYDSMFFGCTNLNSVTCLATDISVSGCTSNWLSGVASTGTFTKAAGMTWTTGSSGIPSTWTIHESGFSAENLTTANYASVTEIAVSSAEGMTNLITLANSTNAKTFEGKTITLEANVELSAGEYFATDFKGTFDGNGKKISGLSGVTALFNKLAGGTVKNLTVEGSSTNGGIVSSANSGLIEGCTSRVNVTSTGTSDIGGITGFMSSSTVKNCINYGTITGSGDGLGGIVGYMQGSDVIDSCINRGNIQSTANKTGGIVGSAFGLVRNCINIGEVSGTNKVGGIAGKENCGASTPNGVYNCANLAAVTANYRAGGIAGVCDISSSSVNYNAIVKNCFNAGSVTRTDTSKESAGGIVGEILTGGSGTCTLTSNYYLPGTAAMGGIGVTNSASVTSPSQSTPSVSDMNTWVNDNNSGNVYKTWIIKSVGSTNYPVPNLGYEW